MTNQERELATNQLRASRERLLGLVEGLTREQLTFRPAEGRWSVGDCLEHLTRVENRVLGIIETKIAEPASQPIAESIRDKDGMLLRAVPNRTEKRQAPEMARPIGQWVDAQELLAAFESVRSRSAQFAAETRADLRNYTYPHGAFGELDCYQWLLLVGLHSERHARQIEEIKADPAFPAAAMSAPQA